MALTVRDAERIKREAGIRPGGGKADGPARLAHEPVMGEDRAAEASARWNRRVHEALEAVGAWRREGLSDLPCSSTPTPTHSHVHVVVCLVHPVTGKQANPHRDQPKLQSWARTYERRRGQIFCHDREAKYAGDRPHPVEPRARADPRRLQ